MSDLRKIKVLNNTELLFEGVSNLPKRDLIINYGRNITIMYEQVYTTVGPNQTYQEALEDESNHHYSCYSFKEFEEFLSNNNVAPYWSYITYSQKDLDKQKLIVSTSNNARGVYLYKTWSEVVNGKFPFTLSLQQYELAKLLLTTEEEAINNGEEQVECLLFLVGTPHFNNWYIQSTNLCFVTYNEDNKPLKNGLLKSNFDSNTGVQTYMLRLCIRRDERGNLYEKRNALVLNQFERN